jgi:hypothetical protein
MKVSKRKQTEEREICPNCNENYMQAIYMRINKKWVKKGIGCPVCLPEILGKCNVEEVINAEYCENCMYGTLLKDYRIFCISETSDIPEIVNDEYMRVTKPKDVVCDCGKYKFDEDMREYIVKRFDV